MVTQLKDFYIKINIEIFHIYKFQKLNYRYFTIDANQLPILHPPSVRVSHPKFNIKL